LWKGGDTRASLAALEKALTLAEPEGYVRTFVDEGAALTAPLRRAAKRGPASAHASRLLAATGEGVTGPEGAALPRPLTERELEVLRLLARGMSNRQISHRLFLTEGTVKQHLHNIYQKLDVRSRTQAVARARELSLLA
jgi:LuxR family maltose regulon positive regulatory protein